MQRRHFAAIAEAVTLARLEGDAHALGHKHGLHGDPIAHNAHLKLCYPNAYHRGYWEGVYDREYRAQQGERDSV